MSLIVLLSIRCAKKPIFKWHAPKGFPSRIWPQFAAVHESACGPKRRLVRRSELVAIGGISGHGVATANRSLLTQAV